MMTTKINKQNQVKKKTKLNPEILLFSHGGIKFLEKIITPEISLHFQNAENQPVCKPLAVK